MQPTSPECGRGPLNICDNFLVHFRAAASSCIPQLPEQEEDPMKLAAFGLAACLAVGISSTCWAQGLNATQKFTDTEVVFDITGPYSNLTLTISGPNGLNASAHHRTGSPVIDLRKLSADDGDYLYQLTAATDEKVPDRSGLDNGRDGGPTTSILKSVSTSGQFQVKGGAIVKHDPSVREEVKRQK
jgi:hypothetical protein